MALSANSIVEIQTGGDDTNGGGFVTGASGSDWSLVPGKRTSGDVTDISTTDAVANGTTTLTSATANFDTTIVGNIIYLEGGTGGLAAGWYQVTARASTTSITLDRTVAAGTGITMNIGGALASLGQAGSYGLITGAGIWIKAGAYSVTSATPNVSGGCYSSTLTILTIEGYQTTRGDLGTAPILTASGISTFTMISMTGGDGALYNVSVDGASLTSSRGIALRGTGYKLTVSNCTNTGFLENTIVTWVACVATGCTTAGSAFDGGRFFNCIAHTNTRPGFDMIAGTDQHADGCIAYANTGASSDGFVLLDSNSITNCVAVGNGRDGIRTADNTVVRNCIVEDNGAGGINCQSGNNIILLNNAGFDNTSGDVINAAGKGVRNIGFVTGSASFFTNSAGLDFSLNNTAGGGAEARAAGYPGVLPVGGTGYADIGALQREEAAPGSDVDAEIAYGFIG